MPILNATLAGEAVDSKGVKKALAPATALIHRGPVIEVSISAAPPITETILASGGEVPDPVRGLALVDTGASGTCIDDDVAAALRLPVTGTATMTSASDQSERNLYPVEIEVEGWQLKFTANRAMGANLKPQGIVALIGRDILSRCVLVYNGATGTFSLAI